MSEIFEPIVLDSTVQNINTNLSDIKDIMEAALTMDLNPTEGSLHTVSSNGVYVALSEKQNISDNSLATTDKTIVGSINELVAQKQPKSDNTLATTDKTVVGAINETVGMVNTVDSTLDAVAEPLINQWDEEWELGSFDNSGVKITSPSNKRNRNPVKVKPNTQYYVGLAVYRYYYDSNMGFISMDSTGNNLFTTSSNCAYVNIRQGIETWTENVKFSINYPSSYTGYYPSRMAKIESRITNRNLLDNPWFTVNQRGQSSYTGAVYCVDRWKGNASASTRSIGNTGLSLTANDEVVQILEDIIPTGTTVTVSVKMSNGTIYSGSGIWLADGSANTFINNSDIQVFDRNYSTSPCLRITAKGSITIRAIKLELGSVSTLANDTMPNYAEELLKCQRYYYRLQGDYLNLGCGETRSTTTCYIGIQLPVTMRAIPTLSTNIQNSNYCRIYSNGSINNPVSASIVTTKNNNIVGVNFQTSSAVLTANQVAVVCLNDNNAYIEFSADL